MLISQWSLALRSITQNNVLTYMKKKSFNITVLFLTQSFFLSRATSVSEGLLNMYYMLTMITVCPKLQALMKISSRGSCTTVALFCTEVTEWKFISFIIFQWQLALNSPRLFWKSWPGVLTFSTHRKMRKATICNKTYGFSSLLPWAQLKEKNITAIAVCNHWHCYHQSPRFWVKAYPVLS